MWRNKSINTLWYASGEPQRLWNAKRKSKVKELWFFIGFCKIWFPWNSAQYIEVELSIYIVQRKKPINYKSIPTDLFRGRPLIRGLIHSTGDWRPLNICDPCWYTETPYTPWETPNYLKNSPHGLWVNSPFGLRPHGLLTIRARWIIVKWCAALPY